MVTQVNTPHVLAAVLAGGKSTRFGSDKAQAVVEAQPLIAHVIAGLQPQCAELVVVGRIWAGVTSLPDRPAAHMGPLAGLNAALHYAQGQGYTHVLSAGCDTLPLPHNLLALFPHNQPSYLLSQPIIGLWPVTLAQKLAQFMASAPRLSLKAWAEQCDALAVDLRTPLWNINTRADLEAFLMAQRGV
jgi:molybdenum cofactor guanylyltransferase